MKSPHNAILSFLICIFSSVALTGCSRKLARTEAQRQLEAEYATKGWYTYIQTGQDDHIRKAYVRIFADQLRTSLPDVAALSDAGLLKVAVVASGVNGFDHIVITPTEKAKSFLAGTFPVGSPECMHGCIKFLAATPTIAILGIGGPADAFGQRMSVVAYQVSWKNTQVGDILNLRHSVGKQEATFIKYDNGWRLEK